MRTEHLENLEVRSRMSVSLWAISWLLLLTCLFASKVRWASKKYGLSGTATYLVAYMTAALIAVLRIGGGTFSSLFLSAYAYFMIPAIGFFIVNRERKKH